MLLEAADGGERLEMRVELACNGMFGGSQLRSPRSSRWCSTAARSPASTREAWDLYHDFDVLRRLEADGRTAWTRLGRPAAGRAEPVLQRLAGGRPVDAGTRPRAILAELLARRNGSDAHRLSAIGHAPHRHRLAVAAGGDLPQGRAHVQLAAGLHGAVPGVPVRLLAGAAVRLDPPPRSRALRADPRRRPPPAAGCRSAAPGSSPTATCPAGESLVRQFLHGQRFFEREFGRRCREFWNPDVFGYNGQLPQIMRGAGITRFLTQKLSWNRFNPPPHHTFTWQGIDGPRCWPISRRPTPTTRRWRWPSCAAPPATTRTTTARGRSLLLFGWGDGGGGPTPDDAGDAAPGRRPAGRAAHRRSTTSDEFFDALEAEAGDCPRSSASSTSSTTAAPTPPRPPSSAATGEGERMLHDVELLCALAARASGTPYPAGGWRELWQLLLLNQFHDILPGSASAEVYEDAARDHAAIDEGAERLARAALAALAGAGDAATPVNTLGVARRRGGRAAGAGAVWVEAPPYGFGVVGRAPDARAVERDARTGSCSTTACCAPSWAATACCARSSNWASGREALAAPGNVLQLYDDRPVAWDAWDIDPFHLETVRGRPPAESWRIGAPARCAPRWRSSGRSAPPAGCARPCGWTRGRGGSSSTARSTGTSRSTMLKVLFPVAVAATDATYEMQFGYAERPTHYSTSHDLARFEVPGPPVRRPLRARLRRGAADRLQVRLSPLRRRDADQPAARADVPDPQRRPRPPRFAYAVMPHAGGWREAGVVAEAARFETPLRWAPAAPAAVVLRGRRSRPGPRHRQAGRGRRRAGAAAVRGPRRPAAARACASAWRFSAARDRCNLLEDDRASRRCPSPGTRSSWPTAHTRSSAWRGGRDRVSVPRDG